MFPLRIGPNISGDINDAQSSAILELIEMKKNMALASSRADELQTKVNDLTSSKMRLEEENKRLWHENEQLSIEITEALNENDIINLRLEEYSSRHKKSEYSVTPLLEDEIEQLRAHYYGTDDYDDIIEQKKFSVHEIIGISQEISVNKFMSNVISSTDDHDKTYKELLEENDELQCQLADVTVELGESMRKNDEMTQVFEHLQVHAQKIASERRDLEVRLHDKRRNRNLLSRPKWIDNSKILSDVTSKFVDGRKKGKGQQAPSVHHFISALVGLRKDFIIPNCDIDDQTIDSSIFEESYL